MKSEPKPIDISPELAARCDRMDQIFGGHKEVVPVEWAIAYRARNGEFTGHCIECGETVWARKDASDGSVAHFMHDKHNPECKLSSAHPAP